MQNYVLKCNERVCGREYESVGAPRHTCDNELHGKHGPSLLRAIYGTRQIRLRQDLPGVFQFIDWLPTDHHYFSLTEFELGRPFCYRSERFGSTIGLENLYVAFSGYWPAKGANLVTRSFKEFEAQASIGRLLTSCGNGRVPPLIVASAGNTANAYNFFMSLLGLNLYLIVPETALGNLQLPIQTTARILAVRGDYTEAIHMAERLSPRLNAEMDGGVRNAGRRAGMATVYINAVVHPVQGTQSMFDHYFQAIGSGAGAIATWEAVENLIADGRFGAARTRIHVAQNDPFTPVPDAWARGQRSLGGTSGEESRERIAAVTAGVLANRTPAYSIAGGLFDVLTASQGEAWKVSNPELYDAARRFRQCEGADISPAGAVAAAALMKAVSAGKVEAKDRILLHITGGGDAIQGCERVLYTPAPVAVLSPTQVEEAAAILECEITPCFTPSVIQKYREPTALTMSLRGMHLH